LENDHHGGAYDSASGACERQLCPTVVLVAFQGRVHDVLFFRRMCCLRISVVKLLSLKGMKRKVRAGGTAVSQNRFPFRLMS
jgi:hypothetical protein